MDPLGNVPIFLSILKDVKEERRRIVLFRELLFALIILFSFLFFGSYVVGALGLRQESISIAGAIILFLIAIKMIFPQKGGTVSNPSGGEPFLVPLAIPLIAGPSILATLTLMARSEPGKLGEWSLAIIIAWSVSAVVLMSSPWLFKIFRERGLIAIERLMGMILVALSVQMFLDGIAMYLG
jgi:multiple antibiotic resistance protein